MSSADITRHAITLLRHYFRAIIAHHDAVYADANIENEITPAFTISFVARHYYAFTGNVTASQRYIWRKEIAVMIQRCERRIARLDE